MTALYGRTISRKWAQDVATRQGYPFHDTINRRVTPTTDVWWTLQFVAEAIEGTYCQPGYIEVGYVKLAIVAKAGLGDDTALQAMESLLTDFFAQVDATQRFTLTGYDPIMEESGGSADSTYRISVDFNYRLSL